ncbi:MAG: cytochrome P450 [Pseudobdellovibrionaceae bacterium]|nr:cytochrome P450 [Pseudobdellovibrionaceae bacterium]
MSVTLSSPLPPSATTFYPLDLYHFYTDFLGSIQQRYREHGNVFRWYALSKFTVLLGAEANQWALVTQQKSLSAAKAWQQLIGQLFQGGLMLRDGADHRQQRRLLMPAFRQEALQYYLTSSEALIDQHIQQWPARCPNIYTRVKELTLEIAVQSFFGISHPKELQIYNRLITHVVAGSIAFNRLPVVGRVYQRAVHARRDLVKLLKPLVGERRRHPTQDMIGQLCQSVDEEGRQLSDDEIVDQLIFIMMAAHDTTASTLSSIFYELAMHPEWQLRVRDEARRALPWPVAQRPDQLPLTLMVIRETLRRHTPLKVLPRVTLEDLEFQGFALPKGSHISVFPSFTHYMEEYWTRPQDFDPLRFSEERAEHKKHPFCYAPFGGGMHSCLGQFFAEKFLSVILGKITLKCSWRVPDIDRVRFQQIPIQVPRSSLPVHLYSS